MSDNSVGAIGADTFAGPTTLADRLHSHERLVLDKLYAVIGNDTLSRTKLEGVAS